MRNIFFFFLLFTVTAANAQVPGFMGKRFSVFVEANPTPAVFVMNVNHKVALNLSGEDARTTEVNWLSFNFRPQVSVEYLVHRDISLGISYSRLATGTLHGYKDMPDDYDYVKDYDVLRGQSIGIHAKFYSFKKSNTIAPIGFYKTLSVYLTQGNTYDTKKSKEKLFEKDFIYPVVSLGLGRQMMLVRNVMLKTGCELGWAFVSTDFRSGLSSEWTTQEYAAVNYNQSLFGYFSFNFNVAVGYTF